MYTFCGHSPKGEYVCGLVIPHANGALFIPDTFIFIVALSLVLGMAGWYIFDRCKPRPKRRLSLEEMEEEARRNDAEARLIAAQAKREMENAHLTEQRQFFKKHGMK